MAAQHVLDGSGPDVLPARDDEVVGPTVDLEAADAQAVIDRTLAAMAARSDAALSTERTRADGAEKKLRIVKGQKEPEYLGWQPNCEKNFLFDVVLAWMLKPNCAGRAEIFKMIDGFAFKDGEQPEIVKEPEGKKKRAR